MVIIKQARFVNFIIKSCLLLIRNPTKWAFQFSLIILIIDKLRNYYKMICNVLIKAVPLLLYFLF